MWLLPRSILVYAVEAGLRFVFAVAGQVEGEDSQCIGSLGGAGRNFDILERRDTRLLDRRLTCPFNCVPRNVHNKHVSVL